MTLRGDSDQTRTAAVPQSGIQRRAEQEHIRKENMVSVSRETAFSA
jgi:hypothetical protein